MNKKRKYHFKVFGAILTIGAIFALGSFGLDPKYFQGKLTLKSNLTPDSVEVMTQDVKTGEEVELNLLDENENHVSLPENWHIEVTYFPQPNIESTVASTNPGELTTIQQTRKGIYTFYAPANPALYKISIYDDSDEQVGVLSQLNVIND